MAKAVLLDSGFLIQVSTIALAEYGVKGNLQFLPTRYLQYVPFLYNHAEVAALFMRRIIQVKQERGAVIQPRVIIPNDTKMFAQASVDSKVFAFVSADAEAMKVYDLLDNPGFEFMNIRNMRA